MSGALQQMLLGEHAAAGGTWDPTQLTVPPIAWYNDTSSITTSGSNLVTWSDISGSGLTLGVTSTPTVNASGLDGKRTISFDGSNDGAGNATTAGKAIFQNVSGAWALILYKNNDGSAAIRHLFYSSTNTNSASRFNIVSSSTSGARKAALRVRRLDADSVATLNAATTIDTNWHAILATMDYSAGDGTIYFDGSQDSQNLSLTTSGNTSNTAAADGFSLCAFPITGASASQSDLAEVVIGAGAIPSSTEIDKLYGWLLWKWGLEANLPGGHPYAGGPP